MEDILVENADIVSKFKFFETYKPDEKEKKKFRITPPRDGVAKVSNVFIRNVFVTFLWVLWDVANYNEIFLTFK